MNNKIKALFSAVATLGLMAAGVSMPAFASGTPGISIVDVNDSLAGSTVSGYDPATTLRVALMVTSGNLSWNQQGSGASLVSSAGFTAQGLGLEGTQDQLNAAFAEITVTAPCSGSYKLYAQVTDSGFVQNPLTGHLYKQVNSNDTFDADKAQAESTPLVTGATNTYGYLVTVTDSFENMLVANFGSTGGWIGASDAAVDGDWTWVGGPEKNTVFYHGQGDKDGQAVAGHYTSWNDGEPNNYNGDEDYAQSFSDGNWNDNTGSNDYTIEYGGMPGDNLSSAVFATDTLNLSVQGGAFTGGGTLEDPYLVTNDTDLYAVAVCASPNAFFKQTANITLPDTWPGDQTFLGHYDGNSKTIAFSPNTPTHSQFGVWSRGGQPRAYVHDLTVTGDLDAGNNTYVGLVMGISNDVVFSNVTVSGSISVGSTYAIGGVDGGHWNGSLNHITSTVNITISGNSGSVGGVSGTMNNLVRNSSWNGTITGVPGSTISYVGGIMGEGDCGSIYHSSSAGSITGDNGGNIGGLGGNICGEVADSHSSVDVSVPAAYNVGGLVGGGSCVGAYRDWATGNVTGNQQVGGLFGSNCGDVQDSYARGNVTGNTNVGSLFGGSYDGNIARNYSTGSVTTTDSSTRGWAGTLGGGLSKNHWVPELSTIPVPLNLLTGEVPYTVSDATSFDYYSNDGWSISNRWSADTVWKICPGVNDGYPILASGYTTNQCAGEMTNASAPTITGTGVVGKALGVNKGNWESGVSFTYQWKLDGNNISGATASTYKPVAGDVAKTVTVEITGSKQGFLNEVRLSSNNVVVSAAPVVVAPTEIAIGEFAGNAWWIPLGFVAKVKAAVKAHASANALTCVGIVAPGGRQAWEKKLGLKRAALTCAIAKSFNAKLKTSLDWRISAPTDKVKRGAALKFNK